MTKAIKILVLALLTYQFVPCMQAYAGSRIDGGGNGGGASTITLNVSCWAQAELSSPNADGNSFVQFEVNRSLPLRFCGTLNTDEEIYNTDCRNEIILASDLPSNSSLKLSVSLAKSRSTGVTRLNSLVSTLIAENHLRVTQAFNRMPVDSTGIDFGSLGEHGTTDCELTITGIN